MQSKFALVGLALANFAAAGPCKPSKPTTVNSLSVTVPTTEISKSSEVPSLSIPESATTTEESQVVITNTFSGGSFAQRDPNTPSGLTGVNTEGQVEFHSGGCYKADGSSDDGCAALSATGNPAGKRDLGSFASMFQTLNSLNTGRRNKYTVQFYYLIFSAGSQACTVSATFGNTHFYSQSLLNFGGVNMQWHQVLQQVEADSSSANFAISMSCTGPGVSMILVDSVFISNQVTPQNIGDFKLDLSGPAANTEPTTTSQHALGFPTTTGVGGVEESHASSAGASSNSEEPQTATNSSPDTRGPQTFNGGASNTEEAITHTEKPISTTSSSNIASEATTETASMRSQGSNSETTNTAQEITSISIPGTTTSPAEPTKTSCKTTCETIENAQNHNEDWNCNVYGLYRGNAKIIPAPSQDLDNDQRTYYQNAGECAQICKTMPGCKSAGYMFASAQCFFSTSVIAQSEVRDQGNDAVDVDWYAVDKCFKCSECESESVQTSAPTITSTTQVPEQATTTKSAESTENTCLPTTCVQRGDWSDHDDWNCQIYGGYQGDFYELPGQDEQIGDATQPEQCMAICKATPGCKSAAISYFWRKCYGSNNVVTQGQTREASDDSTDKEWWGPQCFSCVDNECKSGSSGKTTTQAPEQTTFTTRTSAPATTTTAPADTCIYDRGQYCEFNRFKDHGDTVCIWAGTYPGNTWTETREDYPYQDDPYQCIAICQTLKDCESAGYYSTENRCLFTNKKLKTSDMVPGAHDFDNSVWLHNSCVTCPTCSNSAPLPQTDKCSYKQGDTCTRRRGNDGALCNYQGMWEWYNQQSLDRYPDQSSPEKCMAICQATDYCKGSGYKDGRCMFSFGELKTESFRDWPDHSRDGTWDDPSCFECPGCTE
ncbi:hypothetical protein NW762_014427 [Fusarium torreyae]|uniref:Apple domain-containing protein n=1 Tax=Fusarium torreyae TaxID=1237075 RepID=A0A9W8RKA8_9HYPO|nr:hypothetical protein NW762_014427 [Fusarium torreyae]